MIMHGIEATGIGKRFGDVDVVSDVTFSVEEGEVVAFIGPNGAGKSTTIGVMVGLLRGRGECRFRGEIFRELACPGRTVGVLTHTPPLFPRWTAREHLTAIAPLMGIRKGRVDELLQFVSLASEGSKKVHEFSLGMRQRLGLAMALMGEPAVLVLDEPTVGLDPHGVQWLGDVLRGFADQGGSILISSHQLSDLEDLAHSVILIRDGRLVDRDTLSGFVDRHAVNVVRVRSDDAGRLVGHLESGGGKVLLHRGDLIQVAGLKPRSIAQTAMNAGVLVYELTHEHSGLQEAFLRAGVQDDAGELVPSDGVL